MDDVTIKPHEAKRLRDAIENTKPKRGTRLVGAPRGDYITILSDVDGANPVLVIRKGGEYGEVLAVAPVTNAMLRRLKHEFSFWRKIKSGSMMAFAHGNRP